MISARGSASGWTGPFVPGQVSRGQITYPGYEHLRWEAVVQKIEPERLFSFTWHPYAIDPNQDYSGEPPTPVEFTLQSIPTGTLLRVVESGFDKLPNERRLEAFRMNDSGWSQQIRNIAEHVEQSQHPASCAENAGKGVCRSRRRDAPVGAWQAVQWRAAVHFSSD